jgi:hypothetical protein
LHFHLDAFSSEERLAQREFENARVMAWMAGSSTICLTLESFDEAHDRIENLHRMLGEYLENWDCERLLLRIACRTADWPSQQTNSLDEKFGQANIHELLPLRCDDAPKLLSGPGPRRWPWARSTKLGTGATPTSSSAPSSAARAASDVARISSSSTARLADRMAGLRPYCT